MDTSEVDLFEDEDEVEEALIREERMPEAQGIEELLTLPILLLTFLGAFAYMLYLEGVLDPAHAKIHSPLPLVIVCILVTVVLIFAALYRIADGNLEDLESFRRKRQSAKEL